MPSTGPESRWVASSVEAVFNLVGDVFKLWIVGTMEPASPPKTAFHRPRLRPTVYGKIRERLESGQY